MAEWALTKWVVDTAVWLLYHLADAIFAVDNIDLSAGWWRAHYADMVAVAWVVAPIFLLLGIVQALIRADLGVLGRMLAQLLVVALFTTGAVAIAGLLIGSVDQLSDYVTRGTQSNVHDFLTKGLAATMTAALNPVAQGTDPGGAVTAPLAFLFVSATLTVLGGVLIWLELLARSLVIYAALLFFPLLLAMAIWPKLSVVLHTYIEALVAVIVSKFIIVFIVAVGVSALAATGGQGQGPSLLVGAGLLVVAAWAPWRFYRLLPVMEAGIAHHFGTPFQSGWDRVRTQGWRTSRATATSSTRTHGPLSIAGQRRPVGRPPAPAGAPGTPAGAAARGAAGGATAGGPVGVVASAATAGVRAAARRVTRGGPAGPAGWQTVQVAGGGHFFIPGGGVRNPRQPGGGNG